jgi:hypothetical protein
VGTLRRSTSTGCRGSELEQLQYLAIAKNMARERSVPRACALTARLLD